MSEITFVVDGKQCKGTKGQSVCEAARDNNVYIPTLCRYDGIEPVATCRICTVKINGRFTTACTEKVADGMNIENNTEEINEMRKAIIEMLFVEGNHLCPTCEKSGNCELQALAYRFQMMAPRYPYMFPVREVKPVSDKILLEHNRCICCKRCVKGIKTKDDKSIFSFSERGNKLKITADSDLAASMSDEQAEKAMEICPVGAILKKEKGFQVPIGQRKFDKKPIGSDIEAS